MQYCIQWISSSGSNRLADLVNICYSREGSVALTLTLAASAFSTFSFSSLLGRPKQRSLGTCDSERGIHLGLQPVFRYQLISIYFPGTLSRVHGEYREW